MLANYHAKMYEKVVMLTEMTVLIIVPFQNGSGVAAH